MSPKKQSESSRRVTVRDVAREVGMHFTTVAEALRGSPRVKQATRMKIERAATRLGYNVDPMLSALSAYRSKQSKPVFQGTLAWLNGFDSEDHFAKTMGFHRDCYVGALSRCDSLGYRLETFWLQEPGMTEKEKEMARRLHDKSVSGVVVAPMPRGMDDLAMGWESLCSVRIGYSLRNEALTSLIADQFANAKTLYEKLVHLGFRRIGFACIRSVDERVKTHWSGAYRAMQQRYHPNEKLDLFLDDEVDGSSQAFMKWFRKEKPEVIITGFGDFYVQALKKEGVRVPEDTQVVALSADRPDLDLAGMRQNGETVGMVAIDYLIAVIQRFEVGLESHPKKVMIPGSWRPGATLDETLTPDGVKAV